jgi:hypothetical protein
VEFNLSNAIAGKLSLGLGWSASIVIAIQELLPM